MDLYELHAKDFGPFEDVTVPLHKQGLVWVTGVNMDTKAASNNGSGKSHIFKALAWCLFGESIDGYKGDKVIRRGTKEALVATKFGDDPAKPWTVSRTRKKGAPRLKLVSPTGEEHPGKRDEIQSRVIEMLGLDFTSFRNTVLYGQGDITRFCLPTTKDVDRKDVLHRVLRTGVLKACHKIAKDRASVARKKAKDADVEAEGHRARIEEHDVESLEERCDEWEEDRQGDIGTLKLEAREDKERAAEEMEDGDDDAAEALQEKADGLEAAALDGDAAQIELEGIEAQIDVADEALDVVRIANSKASAAVSTALDALESLEGDECPVCTSPLDSGHAGEHKASVEKEHLAAEAASIKVRDKKVKTAAKLNKLKEERETIRSRVKKGSGAGNSRARLREEIAELKSEREQAKTRAQAALQMAKGKLKQAKAKADEVNPYEAQLKEARARVKKLAKQAEKAEGKATEHRNELAHLEFWSKGFSNQGLPSFILDATMPYLTERANRYLSTLADGDITMSFTTQRELKSSKGEYRDEIDISWVVEGVDDYPPSGGQMKKMELATDFSLMDLMATREGGHLNLLMLDEVLDGLDDEGRQRVLMLLQEIRSERNSIFVISHDNDMSEIFEKSITARKESGVTTLEMAA